MGALAAPLLRVEQGNNAVNTLIEQHLTQCFKGAIALCCRKSSATDRRADRVLPNSTGWALDGLALFQALLCLCPPLQTSILCGSMCTALN